jgi:hypothetical protein
MSDVFLLGAGFSRAISSSMPVLQDLGAEVSRHLDEFGLNAGARLRPADFENWLSYLSEDQPWLNEAQYHRNRAVFLAVSRIIGDVITDREIATRARPMPPWLRSIAAWWHEDQSKVITFNYDDLVEAAYTEVVTVRSSRGGQDNYVSHTQLQRSPLTPIGSRQGAVLTSSPIETFELLKLHGSRSWFYSGRASFYGETIYDACTVYGWAPEDRKVVPWLLEDKVPLVVPPTAGKTGYFNNETIRSTWRRAFRALEEATRLWLVGYSFPETDLLVRFLVQQGCPSDPQITVVNPDSEVGNRIRSLLDAAGMSVSVRYMAGVDEMAAHLEPSTLSPVVTLSV